MNWRCANRLGLGGALLVGALGVWSPGLSMGKAMAPGVGKSFELTRLSGTVTVTAPGGQATKLTGTRQAPVGSTVQGLDGSVRLTASNGHGKTYSGQFSKGSFQALQSATGDPTTEIKLVGCPPPRAGAFHHHGHRFIRGVSASYHHHGHRYLRASVPADFLVVGENGSAQASAGVAKFTLSEACSGSGAASDASAAASQAAGETTVSAQSGSVVASSANHRLQNAISAGEIDQLRCSRSAGYCVVDVVRLKGELRGFFFPGVATNKTTSTYQFCLTEPSKHRVCKTVASNEPVFENGKKLAGGLDVTACQASGVGTYKVSWRMHGVQLGTPLSFHLSSLPKRSFQLPCEAYLGNFDANPQRQVLHSGHLQAVSRISVPVGAGVDSMSVDLAPTGVSGREWVRGVIYADDGQGAPGALVAVTKPFSFTSATPPNHSDQLEFPSGQSPHLPSGKYWIGVLSGGIDGVATIGVDPLNGSGAYSQDGSSSSAPSNPFGSFTPENDYLAVNLSYVTHNN